MEAVTTVRVVATQGSYVGLPWHQQLWTRVWVRPKPRSWL